MFTPVALDAKFSFWVHRLRFLTLGLFLWCGFFGAEKYLVKTRFFGAAAKVCSSNPLLIGKR